jgi:transposase InsO family protein
LNIRGFQRGDDGAMTREKQRLFAWATDVLERRLGLDEFSKLSGKSYRQCQRIVKKVKLLGLNGVAHGNVGRSPTNKIFSPLADHIKNLIQIRYFDLNVIHLQEKLLEVEGIEIKYESLRKIAHSVGIPKKAQKRRRKKVHCLRPRLPREGMLVQFDGSVHRWFADKNIITTLIGGIDDATGKVLGLRFSESEDTFSCFKVMRTIVENHGVPEAFYVDCAGHFGRYSQEQAETQVGRALSEINSKMILASTPQAKGRIERLWGTLQDRLIVELRLKGISDIESANEYLQKEFIADYNKRFSIQARDQSLGYKELNPQLNLDLVFGIKEQRKITPNHTISYNGKTYLIHTTTDLRYRPIEVCRSENDDLRFFVYGQEHQATLVEQLPEKTLKSAA